MRFARLASLALLVVLSASCTFEAATAPAAVKIESATFSPSLGINLSAMTKTSSGLYYQDVVAGTGVTAVSGNTVTVKYNGYLVNGSSFDANATGFKFKLGNSEVIKGWDEGVAGMKVGGSRKLVIPPDLAYGSTAVGSIPANSILVFTVQLISIP
jgi:FKBP-type peptidyl-prolyl cis-trans isomerase FkpA